MLGAQPDMCQPATTWVRKPATSQRPRIDPVYERADHGHAAEHPGSPGYQEDTDQHQGVATEVLQLQWDQEEWHERQRPKQEDDEEIHHVVSIDKQTGLGGMGDAWSRYER